jgi:predicted nucleotidyltransferase
MLEYLITSKAKRSLLKLFFTNPGRAFYIREIAKLIGEPLNAVRRELAYLELAGLIEPRREGNQKYYSVVREFSFFSELKKIIYGTMGLGDYLIDEFRDSKQVELAFIYGSVAKNEETGKSDIDLFVVGETGEEDFHEILSEPERDVGRPINYTLMSKKEFDERRKRGEPFVKRVMAEEEIILKGNPDVD